MSGLKNKSNSSRPPSRASSRRTPLPNHPGPPPISLGFNKTHAVHLEHGKKCPHLPVHSINVKKHDCLNSPERPGKKIDRPETRRHPLDMPDPSKSPIRSRSVGSHRNTAESPNRRGTKRKSSAKRRSSAKKGPKKRSSSTPSQSKNYLPDAEESKETKAPKKSDETKAPEESKETKAPELNKLVEFGEEEPINSQIHHAEAPTLVIINQGIITDYSKDFKKVSTKPTESESVMDSEISQDSYSCQKDCKPLSTIEETPAEPHGADDYEYIHFLLHITEDIIRNDLYTSRDMRRVCYGHFDANKDHLDRCKMMQQIILLSQELGFSLDESDDSCTSSRSEIRRKRQGIKSTLSCPCGENSRPLDGKEYKDCACGSLECLPFPCVQVDIRSQTPKCTPDQKICRECRGKEKSTLGAANCSTQLKHQENVFSPDELNVKTNVLGSCRCDTAEIVVPLDFKCSNSDIRKVETWSKHTDECADIKGIVEIAKCKCEQLGYLSEHTEPTESERTLKDGEENVKNIAFVELEELTCSKVEALPKQNTTCMVCNVSKAPETKPQPEKLPTSCAESPDVCATINKLLSIFSHIETCGKLVDEPQIAPCGKVVDRPKVVPCGKVVDVPKIASCTRLVDEPKISLCGKLVDEPRITPCGKVVDSPKIASCGKLVNEPRISPCAKVVDGSKVASCEKCGKLVDEPRTAPCGKAVDSPKMTLCGKLVDEPSIAPCGKVVDGPKIAPCRKFVDEPRVAPCGKVVECPKVASCGKLVDEPRIAPYEKVVDSRKIASCVKFVGEPRIAPCGKLVDDPKIALCGKLVNEPKIAPCGKVVDGPKIASCGKFVDEPRTAPCGKVVDGSKLASSGKLNDEPRIIPCRKIVDAPKIASCGKLVDEPRRAPCGGVVDGPKIASCGKLFDSVKIAPCGKLAGGPKIAQTGTNINRQAKCPCSDKKSAEKYGKACDKSKPVSPTTGDTPKPKHGKLLDSCNIEPDFCAELLATSTDTSEPEHGKLFESCNIAPDFCADISKLSKTSPNYNTLVSKQGSKSTLNREPDTESSTRGSLVKKTTLESTEPVKDWKKLLGLDYDLTPEKETSVDFKPLNTILPELPKLTDFKFSSLLLDGAYDVTEMPALGRYPAWFLKTVETQTTNSLHKMSSYEIAITPSASVSHSKPARSISQVKSIKSPDPSSESINSNIALISEVKLKTVLSEVQEVEEAESVGGLESESGSSTLHTVPIEVVKIDSSVDSVEQIPYKEPSEPQTQYEEPETIEKATSATDEETVPTSDYAFSSLSDHYSSSDDELDQYIRELKKRPILSITRSIEDRIGSVQEKLDKFRQVNEVRNITATVALVEDMKKNASLTDVVPSGETDHRGSYAYEFIPPTIKTSDPNVKCCLSMRPSKKSKHGKQMKKPEITENASFAKTKVLVDTDPISKSDRRSIRLSQIIVPKGEEKADDLLANEARSVATMESLAGVKNEKMKELI